MGYVYSFIACFVLHNVVSYTNDMKIPGWQKKAMSNGTTISSFAEIGHP
jgi:hypothetical protein